LQALSSGAIFGILGAGGKVGHLKVICGIKLGKLIADKSGGLGITGIFGRLIFTWLLKEPIEGGYGVSGKPNCNRLSNIQTLFGLEPKSR
jgi:hypothetical protein